MHQQVPENRGMVVHSGEESTEETVTHVGFSEKSPFMAAMSKLGQLCRHQGRASNSKYKGPETGLVSGPR